MLQASCEKHAAQYENWFERNRFAYEPELLAVKSLLPENGRGVEIGVWRGSFVVLKKVEKPWYPEVFE